MIIRCTVTKVETVGDKLRVELQGAADSDADWRPMNLVVYECADIPRNAEAHHIGRKVDVEVRMR